MHLSMCVLDHLAVQWVHERFPIGPYVFAASAGMVDRSEWLRGTVADTSKKAAGKQN